MFFLMEWSNAHTITKAGIASVVFRGRNGAAYNRLLLMPLIVLLSAFLFSFNAKAQGLDLIGKIFMEPVDIKYWFKYYPEAVRDTGIWSGRASVIFIKKTNFMSATFGSTASFRWARFGSGANFFSARFDRTADFGRATFDSTAIFYFAKFGSRANFFSAKFDSTADFKYATFDSTTDFRDASFGSITDFSKARFYSTADFRGARFDSTANFSRATFKANASFRNAQFKSNVIFTDAILPDGLDFRYIIDIPKEIDFTLTRLDSSKKRCEIALFGSDIKKIKLDMIKFHLSFPDSLEPDQKKSVYESVLKKIKDDGFMDSYENLDIEYRQFKYHQSWGGWLLDAMDCGWWYYGYWKLLIFAWSAFFYVLFSLFNLGLYNRLREKIYSIGFLETEARHHVKNTLVYTAIIFFGIKMDIDKFKNGASQQHPALFCYFMLMYVSGLICLGFMVNLIFS